LFQANGDKIFWKATWTIFEIVTATTNGPYHSKIFCCWGRNCQYYDFQ